MLLMDASNAKNVGKKLPQDIGRRIDRPYSSIVLLINFNIIIALRNGAV
jgi:hypothetical protein